MASAEIGSDSVTVNRSSVPLGIDPPIRCGRHPQPGRVRQAQGSGGAAHGPARGRLEEAPLTGVSAVQTGSRAVEPRGVEPPAFPSRERRCP
ncbi:hypothetical protein GCM10010252_11770 [Streptomyces aureoverticillatus]|nr:hypothetical protein GCM10010252_11770 [Streptomyces aureoverticillatus]